jgi:hypothetical protein
MAFARERDDVLQLGQRHAAIVAKGRGRTGARPGRQPEPVRAIEPWRGAVVAAMLSAAACAANRKEAMSRSELSICATLALSACVVLPIDPKTGQPVPYGLPPTVVVATPPPSPTVATPPAWTNWSVRLYPLNDVASHSGIVQAMVMDNQNGRGTFSVNYRGDTLQGEATRVNGNYAAFGRIHQEVLGTAPRSFTGHRGLANAAGPKGIGAQCEYVITGPRVGTGVCLFSDGARYQMHFGE